MTELRPLFESSENPKTRALLRAGLGEQPPRRALERTAAALGVGVALSANTAGAAAFGSAAASAAGGSAIGTMAIVKWLAVGALSGTVVAGGTTLARYGLESAPRSDTSSSVAPGAFEPKAAQAFEPDVSRANAPSHESGSPPSGTERPGVAFDAAQRSPTLTPLPQAPTTAAANDRAENSARSGPLTVELECIDRARAALASGGAARALAELSEYERVRSTGTLDREAWILRIDASLALGKRPEARTLARGYLERFPQDAHATRLRELAGER